MFCLGTIFFYQYIILDFSKKQSDKKRKAEDTWELAEQEGRKLNGMPRPSSFCKNEYDRDCIFNYHPNYVSNISIDLYNPVFRKFKTKALEKLDFEPAHVKKVINLLLKMSEVYPYEDKRKVLFRDLMKDILGYPIKEYKINAFEADAALTYNVESEQFTLLMVEVKNDLGVSGDAYKQVCCYFGKQIYTIKEYQLFRHPCFLLHLCGPWLGISGGVFGKKTIVEPLTSMIPLLPMLHHPEHLLTVLATLKALKDGLKELEDYYKSVKPDNPNIPRQSFYPYPNSFRNQNNKQIQFIYLKELDENKSLFLIKEQNFQNNETANQWIIKFVPGGYGYDVHHYCQDKNIAPKIIAFETLEGDWKMIIMEYLAPDSFENLYTYLQIHKLNNTDKQLLKGKAMDIVKLLHDVGFVHGDLRPSNFMISLKDRSLKLIDYDWAGKDSVAK